MKLSLLVGAVLAMAAPLSATDLEECFALNWYFNKDPSGIYQKIGEYEQRVAQAPADTCAKLALGILHVTLASHNVTPQKGAQDKAAAYLEDYQSQAGKEALGQIYLALAYSLQSRDAWFPLNQLSYVNKAISTFDTAVDASRGTAFEWYAHYMRAVLFMNLPAVFKKRSVAEEDYRFVLAAYEQNPDLESYMGTGFYYAGEIEKAKGNTEKAVYYWKQSVAISKKWKLDSTEVRKAKKQLELLGEAEE